MLDAAQCSSDERQEWGDEWVGLAGQEPGNLLACASERHIQEPAGRGEGLGISAVIVPAAEGDDDRACLPVV